MKAPKFDKKKYSGCKPDVTRDRACNIREKEGTLRLGKLHASEIVVLKLKNSGNDLFLFLTSLLIKSAGLIIVLGFLKKQTPSQQKSAFC